jgi:hypothetical protein
VLERWRRSATGEKSCWLHDCGRRRPQENRSLLWLIGLVPDSRQSGVRMLPIGNLPSGFRTQFLTEATMTGGPGKELLPRHKTHDLNELYRAKK